MSKIVKLMFILILGLKLSADALPQFTFKKDSPTYAKELLDRFKAIKMNLPTVSPSTKKWLEDEYERYKTAKNIKILWKLEEHIDYKIYRVNNALTNYIEHLDEVIAVSKLKNTKQTDLMEIQLWANFIYYLNDYNLWQYFYELNKKEYISDKIIKPNFGNGYDMFFMNNVSMVRDGIYESIVLKYLNSLD